MLWNERAEKCATLWLSESWNAYLGTQCCESKLLRASCSFPFTAFPAQIFHMFIPLAIPFGYSSFQKIAGISTIHNAALGWPSQADWKMNPKWTIVDKHIFLRTSNEGIALGQIWIGSSWGRYARCYLVLTCHGQMATAILLYMRNTFSGSCISRGYHYIRVKWTNLSSIAAFDHFCSWLVGAACFMHVLQKMMGRITVLRMPRPKKCHNYFHYAYGILYD